MEYTYSEYVNLYQPDLISFYRELDSQPIQTTYAKIILLSFDEKPIREITGSIVSGNVNVNGSSAVRRTINLTMLADDSNGTILDIENSISINKKVSVQVGLSFHKNVIWFPLGIYILFSVNSSRGTNGWNISIQGKDKMCRLDGTCGGTIPATVQFDTMRTYYRDMALGEAPIETEDFETIDGELYKIARPTITQIIYEAVNHYGEELGSNIIISDIDETVKRVLKYSGENAIYFTGDYSSFSFSPLGEGSITCNSGDDVGYEIIPFSYPGELILKPGDTVVTLLDKIKNTLGNYEYFYDLDGHFVFQQIKNNLNTKSELYNLQEKDYVKSYNNAKYLYNLSTFDSTTQITVSPKYSDIKNDFYVWGERETGSGVKQNIRYHLAIDNKPRLNLATKYMWALKDEEGNISRYGYSNGGGDGDHPSTEEGWVLISPPGNDWREELYRLALEANHVSGSQYSVYDAELIAEWRDIYNPSKWTGGWNPDVSKNPSNLKFWLDFIDTSSALGTYCVDQIGRRTKVINDSNIKTVYNKDVPDIIFLRGMNPDTISKYTAIGQKYFVLQPAYYNLFTTSTTGASCFDRIREMMYQNLSYNTTISLTCLPKYYLDVNNIIYIRDAKSGVNGNYQITQFSLPLAYNGTMTITATEVLTRV